MKVELTLDELCLVVSVLNTTHVEYLKHAAAEPAGGFNAISFANYAEVCRNLADRLHDELEAAEHAEQIIDNMV